mmetsp:Transcript_141612/g.440254  ORF Transcript_141612/g.440254 Transcript_141612/m.440254 type:complete len:211 (+) Transcript_141612:499-1131(+)
MSPMPALEAEPTPEALSSTAMQLHGASLTCFAARMYTSGAGLKHGGLKSDSPEWMCRSSDGKWRLRPAESTQTGTRGLPDVVAMTNGMPMTCKLSSASGTPGQGRAATERRVTVSSFCCCNSVAGSWPMLRNSSIGLKPSALRRLSTAARSSGGSCRAARMASAPGRPAAARCLSQASIMCSKAFPAFSRTYTGHSANSSSSLRPTKLGR